MSACFERTVKLKGRPRPFFAPAQILRLREQWGVDRLREGLAEPSARFMKAVKPWL
jgi:hypothetical protein